MVVIWFNKAKKNVAVAGQRSVKVGDADGFVSGKWEWTKNNVHTD